MKKYLLLLMGILVVFLLVACSSGKEDLLPENNNIIEGKVTQKVDGVYESIAGVEVTILPLGYTVTTNEEGCYILYDIPDGTYDLKLYKEDESGNVLIDVTKKDVTVAKGRKIPKSIPLTEEGKLDEKQLVKNMVESLNNNSTLASNLGINQSEKLENCFDELEPYMSAMSEEFLYTAQYINLFLDYFDNDETLFGPGNYMWNGEDFLVIGDGESTDDYEWIIYIKNASERIDIKYINLDECFDEDEDENIIVDLSKAMFDYKHIKYADDNSVLYSADCEIGFKEFNNIVEIRDPEGKIVFVPKDFIFSITGSYNSNIEYEEIGALGEVTLGIDLDIDITKRTPSAELSGIMKFMDYTIDGTLLCEFFSTSVEPGGQWIFSKIEFDGNIYTPVADLIGKLSFEAKERVEDNEDYNIYKNIKVTFDGNYKDKNEHTVEIDGIFRWNPDARNKRITVSFDGSIKPEEFKEVTLSIDFRLFGEVEEYNRLEGTVGLNYGNNQFIEGSITKDKESEYAVQLELINEDDLRMSINMPNESGDEEQIGSITSSEGDILALIWLIEGQLQVNDLDTGEILSLLY